MPSKKIQSNRRFNIVVDWGGGVRKNKKHYLDNLRLCVGK